MRRLTFVIVMLVVPVLSAGEFKLAGSIPFADGIHSLEWTVPGYDYGDATIKVWFRPADGCFSSDADAVGLVRQWILQGVQGHRVNGVRLRCQQDKTGAVVVLSDVDSEGGMPERLYAYHTDGMCRNLGERLFSAPGPAGWPAEGFRVDFLVSGGRVVGVVSLEEYAERSGSQGGSACFRALDLKGNDIDYGYCAVSDVYRVDSDGTRSYLVLGFGGPRGDQSELIYYRVGATKTVVAHTKFPVQLSSNVVGQEAARHLEDVEAVASQFKQAVKTEHAVELYKSGFLERYVKGLERRKTSQARDAKGASAAERH